MMSKTTGVTEFTISCRILQSSRNGKLREASHLLRCLWLWLRFRPHVTYFTNASFPVAAVFARLGLSRVILRLLGLHPHQYQVADTGKLACGEISCRQGAVL